MSPSIELSTFVSDVAGVIEAEELHHVVLVGHSFGGFAITGVADRMPERLSRLIYLDAAVAQSGVSVFGAIPAQVREQRMRAALVDAKGTRIVMPPPAASFGITDQAQLAWVNRRMTPMPFNVFNTSLTLEICARRKRR